MSKPHSAGIARNTLFFIAASSVTAVIALVTVPAYLSAIGEERFGMYVIATLMVGYFGLSDLGLATATENAVARLDPAAVDERSAIVWTATFLSAAFGLVGGAALLIVGLALFSGVLSLPEGLEAEGLAAVPILAACIPFLTLTSVFDGALNGRERFGTIILLETSRLTALQLLPLGFVYWRGPELRWIAAGFLATFSFATACGFVASLHLVMTPKRWVRPSREYAVGLIHFGKWVAVTSVISPVLAIGDRIILGAVRGATAITVFSIPYNLASRLLVIPFSLIRVAFPRFSALGPEDSKALGTAALGTLAAVTGLFAVIGATFSPPFLDWWIGAELANDAAPVASILFAGIWINGLGYLPYSLLQAQGRPDVVARYHVYELVPFLVVLAVAVHTGGPVGAALAWTGRVLVDTALLLTAARLPWLRNLKLMATAAIVVAAAVNGFLFGQHPRILLAVGLPLTVLAGVGAWLLSPADLRRRIRGVIRRERGDAPGGSPEPSSDE